MDVVHALTALLECGGGVGGRGADRAAAEQAGSRDGRLFTHVDNFW